MNCEVPLRPLNFARPISKFSIEKLPFGKNKTAILDSGLEAQCLSAFLILFGVAVSTPATSN